MEKGRIIIITGAPGTGKSTVAAIIAKESNLARSVYLHTDDFYHYLCKGAVLPHMPEAHKQNMVVIEAFLETAKCFARGGYDVIVDGIIGPWFLDSWIKAVQEQYEVHYIVLRAAKDETLKRAAERIKLDKKTNIELVETMWKQFQNLGCYEANVINTTDCTVDETANFIKEKIDKKLNILTSLHVLD